MAISSAILITCSKVNARGKPPSPCFCLGKSRRRVSRTLQWSYEESLAVMGNFYATRIAIIMGIKHDILEIAL